MDDSRDFTTDEGGGVLDLVVRIRRGSRAVAQPGGRGPA